MGNPPGDCDISVSTGEWFRALSCELNCVLSLLSTSTEKCLKGVRVSARVEESTAAGVSSCQGSSCGG